MKEWTSGDKHPETNLTIFLNCRAYDRVRQVLKTRCRLCPQVISRDEQAVKELIFVCDVIGCECKIPMGSRAHQVCSVCYDMFHALYRNYYLKNMNYFKEWDEIDKRNDDDKKRRDRMGL